MLVVIWANVHGSFILGPVLVGFDWLEDRRDHAPGARRTLLIGVAAAAATLVNPFGVGVWIYTATIGTNPTITRFASEWEPTTIRTFTGAGLFVSAAFVTWLVARRREPVPWPTLLRLACFFALALPAIRGVVWWGLVAPVTAAGLLRPTPSAASGDGGSPATERRGSPVMNLTMVAIVISAAVLALPWWRDVPPRQASAVLKEAPEGDRRGDLPGQRAGRPHLGRPGLGLVVRVPPAGPARLRRLPDRGVPRSRVGPTTWTPRTAGRDGRRSSTAGTSTSWCSVPAQSGELVERIGRDPGLAAHLPPGRDGSVFVREA